MITLQEAKRNQDELWQVASRVEQKYQVLDLLKPFGTVAAVGSFAAKLMVKHDIDIEITNDNFDLEKIMWLH